MADFIIKPASGDTLKLQDEGGDDAISISTTGVSTIANATITTGSGLVGIKEQDAWRITSALTTSSANEIVTANWERDDSVMASQLIGTGMTESSGVFTFPSTGIWLLIANAFIQGGTTGAYAGWAIQITTDNSSYNPRAESFTNVEDSGEHSATCCMCFFDVTNVSTHKCRIGTAGASSGYQIAGDSNVNKSGIIFLRIGDT